MFARSVVLLSPPLPCLPSFLPECATVTGRSGVGRSVGESAAHTEAQSNAHESSLASPARYISRASLRKLREAFQAA